MNKNYNHAHGSWDLHPIWEAGINIYETIASICQKHGLRYYAGYGTALGAIRHKGFIPWDDDIDLLMPRPDYEAFFTFTQTELPQHLQAIKEPIIDGYKLSFGKVFIKEGELLRKTREVSHFPLRKGISIDIFPMDGCPANIIKFYLWQGEISMLNAVLWARAENTPNSSLPWHLKLRFWLGTCINILVFRKTNTDKLVEAKNKIIQCHDYDKTEMAGVVGSEYGIRTLRIPKELYGSGKEVCFENSMIQVPLECEKYLEYVYGDYMTLPPIEEQVPKHLLEERKKLQ